MSHQMTAEQAENRICPYMTPNAGEPAGCVAGQCMAWRWSRAEQSKAFSDKVIAHCKETGEKSWSKAHNALMAEGEHQEFENTVGYCGLAGNPDAVLRA